MNKNAIRGLIQESFKILVSKMISKLFKNLPTIKNLKIFAKSICGNTNRPPRMGDC